MRKESTQLFVWIVTTRAMKYAYLGTIRTRLGATPWIELDIVEYAKTNVIGSGTGTPGSSLYARKLPSGLSPKT